MKYPLGFSLLELLMTVSILSIGLTIAAPSLENLLIKTKITTELNRLSKAIKLARISAITMHTNVTLCPSADQVSCSGQWNQGMLVFIDDNSNRIVDGDDSIIQKFERFPKNDQVSWKAFGNRQFLQMNPSGYTRFQNGTFKYCPEEGVQYARAIILNASGRVRFSTDTNGDGINEDAKGRPLSCSLN